MKKYCIIILFCGFSSGLKAQLFGQKSLGISQGIIVFNAPVLNNRNNANDRNSWISEIEHFSTISRFWTLNTGVGVGNYKNPDNRFETYQSTNFYRFKFGLMLHLPSGGDKIRRVNPFLTVGYNFDLLNNKFKAIGHNRVNVNMKVGGGLVVRIKGPVGAYYAYALNQRVNPDYRTFFQHQFGVLVDLEK